MEANRILVVEDDKDIREGIEIYLRNQGYMVFQAGDGVEGLQVIAQEEIHLAIVDIMMPRMDGITMMMKVRDKGYDFPVIMLSAKSEEVDKIMGLNMGADDYITKPFEMKEVLARIEAVLRRSGNSVEKKPNKLVFDRLIIDMDAFELTVNGKKIDTPPKEMELLFHLASSPNRVYTRNQLLDEVWGFDYFGDSRTVDVHIKRLREKLEGVSDQWSLKTVWGVGYKFEVTNS